MVVPASATLSASPTFSVVAPGYSGRGPPPVRLTTHGSGFPNPALRDRGVEPRCRAALPAPTAQKSVPTGEATARLINGSLPMAEEPSLVRSPTGGQGFYPCTCTAVVKGEKKRRRHATCGLAPGAVTAHTRSLSLPEHSTPPCAVSRSVLTSIFHRTGKERGGGGGAQGQEGKEGGEEMDKGQN